MTSVTISVDQLVEWGLAGYVYLHILFGLVTHYHSVGQVRKFNREEINRGRAHRVSSAKMFVLFGLRMLFGLPWFLVSRLVSPIGNGWHMSPQQIIKW